MVTIWTTNGTSFQYNYRCREGDGGCAGEEGKAEGQVGEGLAHKVCRGFTLV